MIGTKNMSLWSFVNDEHRGSDNLFSHLSWARGCNRSEVISDTCFGVWHDWF